MHALTRSLLHVDRWVRKGYGPANGGAKLSIALTIEHGPHRGVPRGEILRRIRSMIRILQLEKTEVSFVLTDDHRIWELNKIYRKKNRPTDVLAFAMREGDFGTLAGAVLGDVIVSVQTARKQAVERGANVLDEVTMLLAHGLLHLLGWDHDTPAKDRRMRAETDRLCAAAAPPVKRAGPPLKAGSRPRSVAQSSKSRGRDTGAARRGRLRKDQ